MFYDPRQIALRRTRGVHDRAVAGAFDKAGEPSVRDGRERAGGTETPLIGATPRPEPVKRSVGAVRRRQGVRASDVPPLEIARWSGRVQEADERDGSGSDSDDASPMSTRSAASGSTGRQQLARGQGIALVPGSLGRGITLGNRVSIGHGGHSRLSSRARPGIARASEAFPEDRLEDAPAVGDGAQVALAVNAVASKLGTSTTAGPARSARMFIIGLDLEAVAVERELRQTRRQKAL